MYEFFAETNLSVWFVHKYKVIWLVLAVSVRFIVALFLLLLYFWQILLHPITCFYDALSGCVSKSGFCVC